MQTQMKTKTNTAFATKHFHLGVLAPLTQSGGADLFFEVAQAACELGFVVSVLAIGDEASQSKCLEMSEQYPDQFLVLESTKGHQRKIVEESQVMFFPSGADAKTLKPIMEKSVVPMMPYAEGFDNFDAQKESGEAFCFRAGNKWEAVGVMIRAFENFKFAYDWNHLKKRVVKKAETL